MSKKDWIKIVGWEPNPEIKKMILEAMKTEGISLKESASRFALPPLIIEGVNDDPEPIVYENEFRPAIHIKVREY